MTDVLIAAKQEQIKQAVMSFPDFTVCGFVTSKQAVLDFFKEYIPETLLIVEGIAGDIPTTDLITYIAKNYPDVKIAYMTGIIDTSDFFVQESLYKIAKLGVTDIYTEGKVSKKIIYDLLSNHKKLGDLTFLSDFITPEEDEKTPVKQNDLEVVGEVMEGYDNVIIFSSIKPGSGKSFVSVNVATGIAKFGKRKKDGAPPKVAIIEGDLQTLSVGTLLHIEDSRYNLRAALEAVSTVIDENGRIFGTEEDIQEVKQFVKRCFLAYREVPNLFALTGSQLNFKDMGQINPYQYFYLVELIIDDFDVIIVDSNSSLEHKTTGPILQLANTCYYVLDLDFVNVRTNLRYRQDLQKLGVINKVKYILNKYIDDEIQERYAEILEYGPRELAANNFPVAGKIPMIDMAVVLNRLHDGRPVALDETIATAKARLELAKIADLIWPMDNIGKITIEIKEANKPKKKSGFAFWKK